MLRRTKPNCSSPHRTTRPTAPLRPTTRSKFKKSFSTQNNINNINTIDPSTTFSLDPPRRKPVSYPRAPNPTFLAYISGKPPSLPHLSHYKSQSHHTVRQNLFIRSEFSRKNNPMTTTPQANPMSYIPHHIETNTAPPLRPPEMVELQPAVVNKITFFGTSSAVPQPGRANVSALGISLSNSSAILVDCGEATQHQLMTSAQFKMTKIEAILITHLHGDHFFGIFGLLASLGTLSRTTPLTVVGPIGLKAAIDAVFNTERNKTTQIENELENGSSSGNESSDKLTDDSSNYDLKIIEIPDDTPCLLGSPDRGNDPNGPYTLSANLGVDIMCVPIEHRVPCMGYVIHERNKTGKLDAKKAASMGAKGPDMFKLKSGIDLDLKNGTIIKSIDVTEPPTMGKSIAIVQDTHDPTTYSNYFDNLDTMIHECTYDDELYAKSIEHGHSTPSMAATFAYAKNAKNLILTHFSSRYTKEFPTLNPQTFETCFNELDPQPYIPRQLLCQLNEEEMEKIKQDIADNNKNHVQRKIQERLTSPTTSSTPTTSEPLLDPKTSHFVGQITDSTLDICCGADDVHHDHDKQTKTKTQSLQNDDNNNTNNGSTDDETTQSSEQTTKRQRINPQVLAYQREMPFYTHIRTNGFGVVPSVVDLQCQSEFCIEQLWLADQKEQQLKGLSDGTITKKHSMNDLDLGNNGDNDSSLTGKNPYTQNNDQNNSNLLEKKTQDRLDIEMTQIQQPIPPIQTLLSKHSRAGSILNRTDQQTNENRIEQNKTKVWLGADFRQFEFSTKTSTWKQLPGPDIDLARLTGLHRSQPM
jgi:ribonuclease Z